MTATEPARNHPWLRVLRQPLVFAAQSDGRLPGWLGSAWRGAFGRELKSLVCVTGLKDCADCRLYRQCPYPRIFETPPDPAAGKLTRYPAAPHPYALLPFGGGNVFKGQHLKLELRLFGRAIEHRQLLIDALRCAGQRGLGRTRLALAQLPPQAPELLALDGAVVASEQAPASLRVELETPLRIRAQGRLAGPEDLQFGAFFSNLLRRVSLLCTFHEHAFETDFRGLVQQARSVHWQAHKLQLKRLTRYSSRQRRKIDLSGLVGRLELSGDAIQPFWPYLRLGEQTLLGRGTVMGLGSYRLIPME